MLPPTEKKKFRQELARFLLVAEKYQARWHYSQQRPGTGYGVSPSAENWADCSFFESRGFYFAGVHSGAPVNDPLNMHYSGYGNTESIYAYLKAHHAPKDKYRVGDIALYLQGAWFHHHTTVCVIEGTAATAWFMSMGNEAGPGKTRLGYRSDLTGVFRHPALL